MVRLTIGLIFAMAAFFLLVPALRWVQTKQLKRVESVMNGEVTMLYTGAKATVRALGHVLGGLLSAVLCGLILLNPTPNLDLITPILICAVLWLLVTEILGWFVPGTRSRV